MASDWPSLFKQTRTAAGAHSLTELSSSYTTQTLKITAPVRNMFVAIGVTVKIEIYIYILYVCTSNTALAFRR